MGTDGEANVYGLQHDGHARPRPQQLMLLPSCSTHALRSKAGESVLNTHTHTHTCIFSCLPILCNLIWDFFYLLFYWYGNIHPYKIHNTSMSIRKLLSFCCSYTCSHTHTSFSFSLNVCQCVRCISWCPEHTLVPLLLVSTSSAWWWSHQKQSSQSELTETERTRKRERKKQTGGESLGIERNFNSHFIDLSRWQDKLIYI